MTAYEEIKILTRKLRDIAYDVFAKTNILTMAWLNKKHHMYHTYTQSKEFIFKDNFTFLYLILFYVLLREQWMKNLSYNGKKIIKT